MGLVQVHEQMCCAVTRESFKYSKAKLTLEVLGLLLEHPGEVIFSTYLHYHDHWLFGNEYCIHKLIRIMPNGEFFPMLELKYIYVDLEEPGMACDP